MRARRVDDNHGEIIAAFRRIGYVVHDTSRLGGGFPDLVVARNETVTLVEVKDGRKAPSRRRLTPDEQTFAQRFPVAVVESVDDVLRLSRGVSLRWALDHCS
jgi:hypothetical protein